MRPLALFLLAWAVHAQPFTLEQILGSPFPTELTASRSKIAWVENTRGVRNILVAEPPRYQPRKITPYTEDDGQEISNLRWTADAAALVYVRGQGANPASNVKGPDEAVWMVALDASAPRRIGPGTSPAPAPKGDRIAYVHGGQIWIGTALGFQSRGTAADPVWSPDGARLAFVSSRGDHALIGVYDLAAESLRYLDPSTDFDSSPEWSPDGRSIAFIRQPSSGLRPVRQPRRAGEPWSIRIAAVDTGAGRPIWTAHEGPAASSAP